MAKVIKYSMVLGDCDYTIDQIIQGVKSKSAYVERNIERFQVRRGYYREVIVSIDSRFQPSDLEEFEDAIFRFEHNKERKNN